MDNVRQKLTDGKKIIQTRAKHLRIADREGWLTVAHFKNDDLASDDEKEKRLKSAIRSATSLKEKTVKKPRSEHKTESGNKFNLCRNRQ